MTYTLDRERRRVVTRAEGTIGLLDFEEHLAAEAYDQVLDYAELCDCSDTRTDVTPAQVVWLSALVRSGGSYTRHGPTAFVVTSDVAFGMLRMFAILTEDVRPVEVFRDVARAMDWLEAQARHS
jgi:hypothetical protein